MIHYKHYLHITKKKTNLGSTDTTNGGGSFTNPYGHELLDEEAAANSAEMVYMGNHAGYGQEDGQEDVETNLSMLDINKANIEVNIISYNTKM